MHAKMQCVTVINDKRNHSIIIGRYCIILLRTRKLLSNSVIIGSMQFCIKIL
jgi:hypothetical protein